MEESEILRLVDAEPALAADLKTVLEQVGEDSLAAQVESLSIVERDDHRYGCNFYMVAAPDGHWGVGHRTLGLRPGALHIDVVYDRIACVEVLYKRSAAEPVAEGRGRVKHALGLQAAGITSQTDGTGAECWLLVGWSKDSGWGIMANIPTFPTKAQAVAEYWRLKAVESEKRPPGG